MFNTVLVNSLTCMLLLVKGSKFLCAYKCLNFIFCFKFDVLH